MTPATPIRIAHRVIGSGSPRFQGVEAGAAGGAGAVPILLVTGTGYPGATWPEPMLAALAERHRVIVFDHRGTGATPGTPGPYSTRGFAADAVDLLDELGVAQAHVIGHSMGGRVAQWMALDAPERVRTLVLAASGPGKYAPEQEVTRGIPLPAAVALVEKGLHGYIDGQIRSTFFTPELEASMPNVVAGLVDAWWAHRPSVEDYLKHVIARQEHQATELLERITQPTLCLVGDRDTHAGGTGSHLDQSRFLAEALPDAELAVIPGAAHGFFWSHPAASVAAVLEFLARRG